MLKNIRMLAIAALPFAMLATTAHAEDKKAPAYKYVSVAVGINNAENFAHYWSAVGISAPQVDRQNANKQALFRCNSNAKNNDGCMILQIVTDKYNHEKVCVYGMSASGTAGATFIIKASAPEVLKECNTLAGAICKPQRIKGNCVTVPSA